MELYIVLIGFILLAGLLYMGRGYWAWVAFVACLMATGHVGMVTGQASNLGPQWLFHGAAGVALAMARLLPGTCFRCYRSAVSLSRAMCAEPSVPSRRGVCGA